MSVVLRDKQGKRQLITKGAVEEMLSICSFIEIDGEVKPKLTTSARESNSLPLGEMTPSNLAANPSQKSKIIAASMAAKARSLFLKNSTMPITPQRRFSEVMALGICFLSPIYLIPSFFFRSLGRASL